MSIDALLLELLEQSKRIEQRLDSIEAVVSPTQKGKELLSTREAAEALGICKTTLNAYRRSWIEGVHYFQQKRGCLYNRELILDWLQNQSNSSAHQAAIDRWLAKQPINQKRKRA